MGINNISVTGKKLDIFFSKFDSYINVGVIKPAEKDLESEDYFVKALQKIMEGSEDGTYTVHHDKGLFARFDIENNRIIGLHKWSDNTGILMPCWNYFKE